jgi:hypothetical protein
MVQCKKGVMSNRETMRKNMNIRNVETVGIGHVRNH